MDSRLLCKRWLTNIKRLRWRAGKKDAVSCLEDFSRLILINSNNKNNNSRINDENQRFNFLLKRMLIGNCSEVQWVSEQEQAEDADCLAFHLLLAARWLRRVYFFFDSFKYRQPLKWTKYTTLQFRSNTDHQTSGHWSWTWIIMDGWVVVAARETGESLKISDRFR